MISIPEKITSQSIIINVWLCTAATATSAYNFSQDSSYTVRVSLPWGLTALITQYHGSCWQARSQTPQLYWQHTVAPATGDCTSHLIEQLKQSLYAHIPTVWTFKYVPRYNHRAKRSVHKCFKSTNNTNSCNTPQNCLLTSVTKWQFNKVYYWQTLVSCVAFFLSFPQKQQHNSSWY